MRPEFVRWIFRRHPFGQTFPCTGFVPSRGLSPRPHPACGSGATPGLSPWQDFPLTMQNLFISRTRKAFSLAVH